MRPASGEIDLALKILDAVDAGFDAGVVIDPNGLGMPCSSPDYTQSDCSASLVCIPLDNETSCSVLDCLAAGRTTSAKAK